MAATIHEGDVLSATVTKSVPFGALIGALDGTPGLIRETGLTVDQQIRVRVDDYDLVNGRLSASLA